MSPFLRLLLASTALTTLTLTTLLHTHTASRKRQSDILRQSTLLLTSLTDKDLASDMAAAADANFSGEGEREGIVGAAAGGKRKRRVGDRVREGWNREVEGWARWGMGGEEEDGGILGRVGGEVGRLLWGRKGGRGGDW